MGGHHMLHGGSVGTVESANARVGTLLFWNVSSVRLGHLWEPSSRGTTVVARFLRGHGLNLQYAYHLRNIKVRFRIMLRLELGTTVDVVFRERTVSATKILLKIHTCIFHIDNGYSNFPCFLVIRYTTDWSRHYLCICRLLHELHVWTLGIGYVERYSCNVIHSAHRKLNGRVWICV